jgi:hypothetical protein
MHDHVAPETAARSAVEILRSERLSPYGGVRPAPGRLNTGSWPGSERGGLRSSLSLPGTAAGGTGCGGPSSPCNARQVESTRRRSHAPAAQNAHGYLRLLRPPLFPAQVPQASRYRAGRPGRADRAASRTPLSALSPASPPSATCAFVPARWREDAGFGWVRGAAVRRTGPGATGGEPHSPRWDRVHPVSTAKLRWTGRGESLSPH